MDNTSRAGEVVSGCQFCGSELSTCPEFSLEAVCAKCGFVGSSNAEHPITPQEDVVQDNGDSGSWVEFSSIHNATERRLTDAIDTLDGVAEELGLNKQQRIQCAELLGQALVEGVTDGRNTNFFALAAVYWGERQAEQPVPISVIADIDSVSLSKLKKACNTLQSSLNILSEPTQPTDYVLYLSRELDIGDQNRDALIELLTNVETTLGGCGVNPVGVAAAGAYQILGGVRTQTDICRVAGISTETLRVRLSEIKEMSPDGR